MKVATWNLWWRYGEPDTREVAIRHELQQLDADVIALQEIWHTETRNLAEELGAWLGYHVAYVPSPAPEKWQTKIGDDSFGIGNAVLSRWPIADFASVRLPSGDAFDEGRVAVLASVQTPYGQLPFMSTHLNSGWSQSSIRTEQLATACRLLNSHPPAAFPPVLCGDFNAMDDFDEVRAMAGKRDALVEGLVLLDAWNFVRPLDAGFTWNRLNPHVDATHEPSARIDYVFVGLASGDGMGKPVAAGVFADAPVGQTWASDHFGVWVDLATPGS